MEKIKCWVTFCDEYPGGMVWENREDALQYTKEVRESSFSVNAYARVKHYTREELNQMTAE
jgi:hypothetical protein